MGGFFDPVKHHQRAGLTDIGCRPIKVRKHEKPISRAIEKRNRRHRHTTSGEGEGRGRIEVLR